MYVPRMKSSARLLAPILLLVASACATVGPATDGCAWVKPIYVSREDVLSDGTVDQILGHNEKWERICAGAK